MNRHWLVCPAVLAGAAAIIWWLRADAPIGPKSFQRIEPGMTLEEVEAVIGLPPGNYNQRGQDSGGSYGDLVEQAGMPWNTPLERRLEAMGHYNNTAGMKSWWGPRHAIFVFFDSDGRALGCYLFLKVPAGP